MPRLLVYAMCQKAIIDRDETLSLISLFNGIELLPEAGQLEPSSTTAFNWSMVSCWLRTSEDDGKTFEQRLQVVFPDGSARGESILTFKMSSRIHQNTVTATEFPVGQSGEYQMRISLREVAEGRDFEIVSDYPFEVTHPS